MALLFPRKAETATLAGDGFSLNLIVNFHIQG